MVGVGPAAPLRVELVKEHPAPDLFVFLADPFGRIIAKASHDKEEILLGEVNLALLEDTRRNWPFLRDRRIDAYAPITKRFLDPVNSWPDDGDSK